MQQSTPINPIHCTYSIKPESAETKTLSESMKKSDLAKSIRNIETLPLILRSMKFWKFQADHIN
jgi:hypothetical protein